MEAVIQNNEVHTTQWHEEQTKKLFNLKKQVAEQYMIPFLCKEKPYKLICLCM